jgi:hypothetical protein
LIQGREALAAQQQPPGLGPRRPAQVRQRRRDDDLGLGPVVEAAFGVKNSNADRARFQAVSAAAA